MRKLFLFFTFLLLASSASAQVTGTVTDSDAQTWNNGNWSVSLVPLSGNPPLQYYISGTTTPVSPQTQSGSLNGSGAFSVTLPAINSNIAPSNSAWQFSVCPAARPAQCFIINIQISSLNQNITGFLTPTGVRINMASPLTNVAAYIDPEIINAIPGQTYFNLTNQTTRLCVASPCSGANWQAVAGSSIPGGSTSQLQFNNSGTFAGASGITTPDGNNLITKGPVPSVNVMASGARAVSVVPQTTASCQSGQATVTLASASTFQNGDGITIYGCGSSNTLATPGVPTITSGISNTFAVPDAVITSVTGASTYNYKIFAIDQHGGVTLAGTVGTTNTGPTALGMSGAISVTSASLSGNTLTLTLPSTNSLAAGNLVHFTKSSNAVLSGYYTVASVAGGGTTITINNVPVNTTGSAITSTGGNVVWAVGNHLTWTAVANAWEYGICAERPGDVSYSLIGLAYPTITANYASSTSFTDWGSTITTAPNLPSYLSNATCSLGASTNDYLTTTIVSGAGTTNLTLSNNASQTISAQTALFDDEPAFLASANLAHGVPGGVVFIPPGIGGTSYVLNSRFDTASLSITLSIDVEASIIVNETISSRAHWYGTQSAGSVTQFQAASTPGFVCITAWPCFYEPDEVPFIDSLAFGENNGNQSLVLFFDGQAGPIQGGRLSRINCTSGGTADFSGICIVARPASYNFTMEHISVGTGPNNLTTSIDTVWTPGIYFDSDPVAGSIIDWHLIDWQSSARTFYQAVCGGAGQNDEFTHYYSQGSLLPILTMQNVCTGLSGINLRMSEFTNDTSYTPYLEVLGTNLGNLGMGVSAVNLDPPSSEGVGGRPGWLSGTFIPGSSTTFLFNTVATSSGVYTSLFEKVICSGVYALGTGVVNNNGRVVNSYSTCSTGGSAVNINHLTDHVDCSGVGDPNGITGYAVSAPFLVLRYYIPASDGAFDIDQINQTGAGVTPGAYSMQCAVKRP